MRQSRSKGLSHLGLGILPESPIIVGRVFNYLVSNSGADGYDPQDLWTVYGDLAARGVAITSNSFNHPDFVTYTDDSQLHDRLVRSANGANGGPPMAIYVSAGNDEDETEPVLPVTSPATAKNVMAVGASENVNGSSYQDDLGATGLTYADNGNEIWARSRIGPTDGDGRIKPDLVAPASGIEAPRTRDASAGTSGCLLGLSGTQIDGGSPAGQRHLWSRGTSFSAPLAAGAGALLYTWFKNTNGGEAPKPSLLKAMQITLARELTGSGHPPDAKQGWGKADLARAFATDGRYAWNNEYSNSLMTQVGQIVTLPTAPGAGYRIKDTTKPVRVTAVWTDAYGNPANNIALVNNLDLTVRIGGGRYAIGNDFSSTGRSNIRIPGAGGSYDSRNNVEQVVYNLTDAGSDHFKVEVFAKALGGDGINQWPPAVANQQNFALFIENAEVYQNDASYPSQAAPPTTVQAGSPYAASIVMQNTGNTAWTEGPNNYYRLGSITAKSAFDLDGRAYLNGQTVAPGGSGTFTLSGTAPYSAGTYPLQWQMLEEGLQFFGQPTSLFNVTVTPTPYSFYTVAPCRVLDTRNPPGPYGGPSLNPAAPRTFVLRGQCGIPTTATSVSVNLTVVNAANTGHVTVYPANIPTPLASTLNYRAGIARANNAVLTVDALGQIEVVTAWPVDLILDVNGYFQ